MGGFKAFNRIFAFLLAQVVLLVGCAGFLFYLNVVRLSEDRFNSTLPIALLFCAICLLALRLAWTVGNSGVELSWGTSVKIHVKRWLEPTLLAGSFLLVLAALVLTFAPRDMTANIAEEFLSFVAIGLPLGVSLLLIVSAFRRAKAYESSHSRMVPSVEYTPAMERIKASIASDMGEGETSVRPNPQGFAFAGLTSKPWHDPAEFPWVKQFEQSVEMIAGEYLALKDTSEDTLTNYKYAGLEGDFWQSFQFATRYRELTEKAELCPGTWSLLKTVPHYPWFRDAMFSILQPGGIISPHRDVSNVFLTLHLPLIAPGNGFIEVGGLRKEWRKGEALIFDSSYNHQAQNNSDEERIILLVDFLHPDLSDDEAAWVAQNRL